MLKLDLKLIFWSLAVHRYPKQPPRVIILAAMGPGMKLVIDRNFLAEKNENLKFFCKTYVIYIKRKLRTCRIQIQEEKVWFLFKKDKKIYFFEFFLVSEWSKNLFFRFFQNFQLFFWKIPQGVLGNVKRNKVMKYELIWSVLRGVTHNHLRVRAHCNPPCSIGLTVCPALTAPLRTDEGC